MLCHSPARLGRVDEGAFAATTTTASQVVEFACHAVHPSGSDGGGGGSGGGRGRMKLEVVVAVEG